MNTLAVDIGGTKFTVGLFEEDKLVRRESRATDRGGGRVWMTRELGPLLSAWSRDTHIDRCGIGFGGPVFFDQQRVVQSTHAGGWGDFDLPAFIKDASGVHPILDNDANAGALGEAEYGAGRGACRCST